MPVIWLNISIVRCCADPWPELEKSSSPGLLRAKAIISFTFFTGTDGWTTITPGETTAMETGRMSFVGLNESFMSEGVMVMPDEFIRSVWPSGAARAMASVAIVPPAPGRLSATTGWPHMSDRRCAMSRPVVSTPPPGASAIIIRMGLAG